MDIYLRLSIPPNFFESVKKSDEESISEQIVRGIIESIIGVKNITKTPPESEDRTGKFLPDYISNDERFEVTLAINQPFIKKVKGIKNTVNDIDLGEIEEDVLDAIERKSKKNYLTPPNLCIFTLYNSWLWVAEPNKQKSIAWLYIEKERNFFFEKIYNQYIKTKKFKNIYVILLTMEQQFALFDIKQFAKGFEDFITIIGVKNPKAYPNYCVEKIENEQKPLPRIITNITYYTNRK